MQRKSVKKNVYNTGKNTTNQELVFQHMSNHYRRILNAKKAIDTAPPYSFKPRRNKSNSLPTASVRKNKPKTVLPNQNTSPLLTDRSISVNSCKESCWGIGSLAGSSHYHVSCCEECPTSSELVEYNCFDMDLINRITYDTKNGPSAYCDEGWMEIKAQHNDTRYRAHFNAKKKSDVCSTANSKRRLQSGVSESGQKRKLAIRERLTSSDVTVKKNQFFSSCNAKFYPRILKTEVVSKLRSMRVYYPPRRKDRRLPNVPSSEMPTRCHIGGLNCKCTNICVCEALDRGLDFKKTSDNLKEQSQTSSRDSAYNGGVSSLPESRSPTPDQRQKKECFCVDDTRCHYFYEKKEINTKLCHEKESQTKNSRSSSPNTSPTENKHDFKMSPDSRARPKAENEKDSFKKMKEDALYIKFIQDITVEVLQKGLYTNKALKKVMKRHMINNLHILDKDRMLREVDNLRIQLGIPNDKDLLDLDVDVVESSSDLLSMYPTISDSELVIPTDDKISPKQGKSVEEREIKNVDTKSIAQDGMIPENPASPKSIKKVTREIVDEIECDSESDDDDILSIIQVMKAIRDKRKAKATLKTSGGNANKNNSLKERGYCCNKNCKIRTKSYSPSQQRTEDRDTTSSSSHCGSEDEKSRENISKVMPEGEEGKKKEELKADTDENDDSSSQLFFVDNVKTEISVKKCRSVSFWNNEDTNISSFEDKEEKTLIQSKQSTEDKKK